MLRRAKAPAGRSEARRGKTRPIRLSAASFRQTQGLREAFDPAGAGANLPRWAKSGIFAPVGASLLWAFCLTCFAPELSALALAALQVIGLAMSLWAVLAVRRGGAKVGKILSICCLIQAFLLVFLPLGWALTLPWGTHLEIISALACLAGALSVTWRIE